MSENEKLTVKVYGTRGSCSAAYSEYMKYGGNTSCVVVKRENIYLVLDAGTGILKFGHDLAEAWKAPGQKEKPKVFIFLSHIHFDHVIGLPLFLGLVSSFASVSVYGNRGVYGAETLDATLNTILGNPGWPVTVRQLYPEVKITDLYEGDVYSYGADHEITLRAYRTRHPGGGLIYTLSCDDRKIAYGLDYELEDLTEDVIYREFAADADLLIFDGTYTREDYSQKKGFGHSYWQKADEVIRLCDVKRAGICHYDWSYTDNHLDEQAREALELNERILFLEEGMEIRL